MSNEEDEDLIIIDPAVQQLVEAIAREELHIGTLQVRNRDRLDFHDVHVAALQKALLRAYNTGLERALATQE